MELLSIADDSTSLPAIDSTAFPNTQSAYYLASSPHGVPGTYSLVSFDYGYLQEVIGSERNDFARCVAGAATCSDTPARFIVQNGVVTDNRTGLHWQQGDDPTTATFTGAATYCKSLVLGTGQWRVPTLREFVTLIDLRTAAFDPNAFPGTTDVEYWTADPFFGDPGVDWQARPDTESNGGTNTSPYAVKCVQ
jgi:hypothetical protein